MVVRSFIGLFSIIVLLVALAVTNSIDTASVINIFFCIVDSFGFDNDKSVKKCRKEWMLYALGGRPTSSIQTSSR
jgi:hypothetical protein